MASNIKVDNLMSWVRLIVPIAVASIAWYINQMITELHSELESHAQVDYAIQNEVSELKNDFYAHRSSTERQIEELQRRITTDESDLNKKIERNEFNNWIRRIEKLEERSQR